MQILVVSFLSTCVAKIAQTSTASTEQNFGSSKIDIEIWRRTFRGHENSLVIEITELRRQDQIVVAEIAALSKQICP